MWSEEIFSALLANSRLGVVSSATSYTSNFSGIAIIRYKINHQITAEKMRVIDETGQNVGILSKSEALQHAQSKGLDLIEIAPGANPPVARIISYDKFRYQQKKEEKKKQQKGLELKQVRLSARSADNDLAIKAKKVNEFLEKGHVVEIFLRLRGREKYNKEWATERLRHFTAIIGDTYRVLSPQTFSMQGIIMQITKKQ